MASENFAKLQALVLADEALQNELFSERDPMAFVSLVVSIAVEREVPVTDMEVWQKLSDGRSAWVTAWTP
jgi:hypothetical protein